jgi:hypothetical protein
MSNVPPGTDKPGTFFDGIEEFLERHKNSVTTVLAVAGVALSAFNAYQGAHNPK